MAQKKPQASRLGLWIYETNNRIYGIGVGVGVAQLASAGTVIETWRVTELVALLAVTEKL